MPLPQLGLSLSLTDNPGSPLYAGCGEGKKMAEFDSAFNKHTIIITISDEIINEVELEISNKKLHKIKLPTYKMMIYDDKTEEQTFYEVTRDSLLINELKSKSSGGFTFLGLNLFKKTSYTLPVMTFEPLTSIVETFEVSKFRSKKEEYLSYTLHRNDEQVILISGKPQKDFFNKLNPNHFFYIVDHNDGQKFIGDISYREKFIKTIPMVKIQLIKRSKKIKEYELDKKGNINRIIYL